MREVRRVPPSLDGLNWEPIRADITTRTMRRVNGTIEMSASDLSYFLACRHRTALDLAVARGLRAAPTWVDPALVVLQQRGLEHEHRYVETLRSQGLRTVDLTE